MSWRSVLNRRTYLVGLAVVATLLVSAGITAAQQQRLALVRLTNDPAHDVRPSWSSDGKRIAFQSYRTGTYQIWTINADGSDERRLSSTESDDRHPSWSPDGRLLAFDSGNEAIREIWVMDAEGRDRRQITTLGAFASFPSWSPDGRRLAFYVYRSGVMDLWTVAFDGVTPRALTSGLADERRSECTFSCHVPSWSPDGTTLAFSGGDHHTIWTLPLDGGSPFQATSGEEHAHFPWYLPDGRLAYVVEHVTTSEAWTDVWVIDLTGRRPTELLLEKVRVQGPYELSPDGQQVLFHSPRGGNFDLYLADLGAAGGYEALQTVRAAASNAPGLGVVTPGRAEAAPAQEGAAATPVSGPDPARALLFVAGGLAAGLIAVSVAQVARSRSRRSR